MKWEDHKPRSPESIAYNKELAKWAEKHPKLSSGYYNWELMKRLLDAPNTNIIRMAARRGGSELRRLDLEHKFADTIKVDIGKPLTLKGDHMVAADVQLPTTSFFWCKRVMEVGQKYNIKNLINPGDVLNLDHISKYAPTPHQPTLPEEIGAGRALMEMWLEWFDTIYILPGNHERRLRKALYGAMDIYALVALITPPGAEGRIITSHYGYCYVKSDRGVWRVTHGSKYAQNQLSKVVKKADIKHQHIINHHQHHCASGFSKSGKFEVYDNGGLFDQSKMGYTQFDDNDLPLMQNGFGRLQDGYFHQYSNATNWQEVLS